MSDIHWHNRPTIGVLAGWQFYRTATNLSYLKPVFSGIDQAARDLSCNAFLGCGMGASASPTDPARPAWPAVAADADYVPIAPENTDGLIIFSPLHSPARSQQVQAWRAAGHPVLFIGSGEDGPTIAADNAGGISEAVAHLVHHGHRRIAFLAGSPSDMGGDTGDRLWAYESALAQHRLPNDPRLVVYGRHVYDGGYAGISQIIASGASFSALLASNDEMALGAMQALKEQGCRIPQDVAVIGFDNRLEGTTQDPALSSVHVPLYEMGYHAVELMVGHLKGTASLEGTTRVRTRLVTRASCGCGRLKQLATRECVSPDLRAPGSGGSSDALVATMATSVLNQAQYLSERACRSLCRQLVHAFDASLEHNDSTDLRRALDAALADTIAHGDDAQIWQDAVSILKESRGRVVSTDPTSHRLTREMLEMAHETIGFQMLHQHRQMIVDQRASSSRLSLLTAGLQTALDEGRIYEILAEHLQEMAIDPAMLVLFEAQGEDPVGDSLLRNGRRPEEVPIRFASPAFPPDGLFQADQPVQLAIVPLVDQTGQLGYVVFGTGNFDVYGAIVQQFGGAFNTARLYREATEGRRLAEEANRMKSRFLSTISHELRTPLNLIVGLSGMVVQESDEGDVPLPETARNDVERIHAYSQHLGGLIGDVIDLATSDAGELRLHNEHVDLCRALRIVAESGRQLAKDKGLAFECSLPETGPWVWGDPTRLRQVALNLVNNAVKFTTEGSVRLWLVDRGDAVTVLVSDTGLGIPPEEQQAVFDEFRQSDRSVALGYGGLGLGLAISKQLVALHGGSIDVQSTGIEGAGSTFSFTLPTIGMPAENPSQGRPRRSLQLSVVVLTNQLGTCERLCEELYRRGFEPQTVLLRRGMDWRAELRHRHADAIILDVSTDSALGWDTLKELKGQSNLAGTPVLWFSSSAADGSLLELDYLTKPIEVTELTRALDQHWLMTGSVRPTRTILVVDDEPATLDMHARIVRAHSAGNRVLQAQDGQAALALLHQERVDLVLLDLQMPEMDGFEVLEAMRGLESMRDIPVIVVTGQDLTESDIVRLNQGVTTILRKGLFSKAETIAHISAALENKRRLSEEAQRLVRIAMAYVHEHCADDLSREVIAQHVGITEDHLTFCFRQELGTTPIQYIHRYRINQAKRLLKESEATITEIAGRVGFSDSGYFSRIFRRETGTTPSAFRRS